MIDDHEDAMIRALKDGDIEPDTAAKVMGDPHSAEATVEPIPLL